MFMGAKYTSQKCHPDKCPQLFTWCRTRSAEMPTCWRTIGREPVVVHRNANMSSLSPTNHRGPWNTRRNAANPSPPPVLFGAKQTVQKCRGQLAPREGPTCERKNVRARTPFPPITGGHACNAEMPLILSPHRIWAVKRAQKCQFPFAQITPTRGHPLYAEMPLQLRLATKKGKNNGQKIRR